jgi:hypothetical protein
MILTIIAIVFLALYALSFVIAATLMSERDWKVSAFDVAFHAAAGFAVAVLVLQ